MSHDIFTRQRLFVARLLRYIQPCTQPCLCMSVSLPMTPYRPPQLDYGGHCTHPFIAAESWTNYQPPLFRFRIGRITINENICQKKHIRIRCKNSVVSSYVSSTYCRRLFSRYLKSHTKHPLPTLLPAQETLH